VCLSAARQLIRRWKFRTAPPTLIPNQTLSQRLTGAARSRHRTLARLHFQRASQTENSQTVFESRPRTHETENFARHETSPLVDESSGEPEHRSAEVKKNTLQRMHSDECSGVPGPPTVENLVASTPLGKTFLPIARPAFPNRISHTGDPEKGSQASRAPRSPRSLRVAETWAPTKDHQSNSRRSSPRLRISRNRPPSETCSPDVSSPVDIPAPLLPT